MQVMILTGHMQEGPHNLYCYVPLIAGPMKNALLAYKWLHNLYAPPVVGSGLVNNSNGCLGHASLKR